MKSAKNCMKGWTNNLENRLLGMFSISRKAGKLVFGFDSVKEELAKTPTCVVYLASDLSEKSEKEISFLCSKAGVAIRKTPLSMFQISNITNRLNGVLCVTDQNLCKKIDSILQGV